jgi:hypothetical protein
MAARDEFGRYARTKGKGAFVANIEALAKRVEGRWRGAVEVNQVYAHYQHAHPEFKHPRGGQAFYLQAPLYRYYRLYYRTIAQHAITSEGTDLKGGFAQVTEHLSKQVYIHAPREFEHLRNSGHPYVTRDGVKVYNRQPLVKRLSERELRENGHLRYLTGAKRGRRR